MVSAWSVHGKPSMWYIVGPPCCPCNPPTGLPTCGSLLTVLPPPTHRSLLTHARTHLLELQCGKLLRVRPLGLLPREHGRIGQVDDDERRTRLVRATNSGSTPRAKSHKLIETRSVSSSSVRTEYLLSTYCYYTYRARLDDLMDLVPLVGHAACYARRILLAESMDVYCR